ncbi:hypothetical protein ACHAXM_000377 [Skeletonema potamos]
MEEYEGNWKDALFHGWGKMTCADGSVYEGNWKDDNTHGWGEMTYADGAVYVGNWENGNKNGWGKMTYADGGVYEGNWKDDNLLRWGEMTYAYGRQYEVGHCSKAAEIATKRVYVGNLSWSVTSRELNDHMNSAGEVTRADILQAPDGRSKGCGIVEFATSEEAANAVAILHQSELMGRRIFVRGDRGGEMAADARSKRVYVGNLAYWVAWQDLEHHMRYAGDVRYTKVMMMTDGRSKGFGIVEFATAEAAKNAIETLNGTQLCGRRIFVREDREQKDSVGGGGGSWNRSAGSGCGGG